MTEQLAAAEVGQAGLLTITGIGSYHPKSFPRYLITHPKAEPLGYKSTASCANVFRAWGGNLAQPKDIYFDTITESGLKFCLITLENVLNDPNYPEDQKDIPGLFRFLNSALCLDGLAIIIEAEFPPFPENDELYLQIAQEANEAGFDVILDQLSENQRRTNGSGLVEQRISLVWQTCQSLGIADPALQEGLKKHGEDYAAYWLVLQKKPEGLI